MKYTRLFIFAFIIFSNLLVGQVATLNDLTNSFDVLLKNNVENGYINYENIEKTKSDLSVMRMQIENMDIALLSDYEKISFYINAYNLIVIDEVMKAYPIPSVKEIGGFFDRVKHKVAGQSITLNELEKDILLKQFHDPRYHFVLVCGAIDCPKIMNEAISPNRLETQLDNATRKALNDPGFIKREEGKVGISEIFKWYVSDFGGSKKDVISFINNYVDVAISASESYYYNYNWTLNDTKYASGNAGAASNNSFRYVTSAAISKGGLELKVFNNLYSQNDGSRSTYFTTSLSFLYGLNNRLNVGVAGRYRRVLNADGGSSPLDVFNSLEGRDGRQRLSAIGPQIRWAPSNAWEGFSLQSSLTFPIGQQLSGGDFGPFLDWAGPVFITQLFYDRSVGDKFSLFTEVDFLYEEIGGKSKTNQVSIPVTSILSYYPVKNVTIYGLAGFSPFAAIPFNYFYQMGLGFKYQMTPNFEVELLATNFSNRYLERVDGNAATWNIGFRYSR